LQQAFENVRRRIHVWRKTYMRRRIHVQRALALENHVSCIYKHVRLYKQGKYSDFVNFMQACENVRRRIHVRGRTC
jgi:hypothetical protein